VPLELTDAGSSSGGVLGPNLDGAAARTELRTVPVCGDDKVDGGVKDWARSTE